MSFQPYSGLVSKSTINHVYFDATPTLSLKEVRGSEAVAKMLNRKGMGERADQFFCNQPKHFDYQAYITEVIRKYDSLLPVNPIKKDYEIFAHRIFFVHRKNVVDQACREVEANPKDWTFRDKGDWEMQRLAFQDFMWFYAKSTWSYEGGQAIIDAMLKIFPSLSSDFRPCFYTVVFLSEHEDFYPNNNFVNLAELGLIDM